MSEFKFEIIKTLGVLSEGTKGWQKEINMVSWNERKPKLDIRDWGPNHEKIGKGVSLNQEELLKLKEILVAWDGVMD
ncbi:MAG: PC4/YdbC family ssDNA-binding protein [Firmicutes bacterium]|nr:PC4/YdbC family ssDNA-binding protein [Bacillota bacterium]